MKGTFTYFNLGLNEVVQHSVTDLESAKAEGAHVEVKFKDDKGRRLKILTNSTYHLRIEEALPVVPAPPPERPTLVVEGD